MNRTKLLIGLGVITFAVIIFSGCKLNAAEPNTQKSEQSDSISIDISNYIREIDSIYIEYSGEPFEGEFVLKNNELIRYIHGRYLDKQKLTAEVVDSLIIPIRKLFIENSVPIKLGKKKINEFWDDEVVLVNFKIYLKNNRTIVRKEEYIQYVGDYEYIYSEEYMKILMYIWNNFILP